MVYRSTSVSNRPGCSVSQLVKAETQREERMAREQVGTSCRMRGSAVHLIACASRRPARRTRPRSSPGGSTPACLDEGRTRHPFPGCHRVRAKPQLGNIRWRAGSRPRPDRSYVNLVRLRPSVLHAGHADAVAVEHLRKCPGVCDHLLGVGATEERDLFECDDQPRKTLRDGCWTAAAGRSPPTTSRSAGGCGRRRR